MGRAGAVIWRVVMFPNNLQRVELSDDGGATFHATVTQPDTWGNVSLVALGAAEVWVLVSGPDNRGDPLAVTVDGGATWSPRTAFCAGESDFILPFGHGVLDAVCAGQPGVGSQAKSVTRSTDDGESWKMVHGQLDSVPDGRTGGYVADVAALSPNRLWIAEVGRAWPLVAGVFFGHLNPD
jgi:hypothetical protein